MQVKLKKQLIIGVQKLLPYLDSTLKIKILRKLKLEKWLISLIRNRI